MTVKWNKSADVMPIDNQDCYITDNSKGCIIRATYKAEARVWLDLFASPEAGAIYTNDLAVFWCDKSEMDDKP